MATVREADRTTDSMPDWQAMARDAIADEARLRAALEEADIVPQLLVASQLSGDDTLLERAAPHITGGWSFMNDIPDDLASEIREALVAALKALAQGRGESMPKPVPERFIHLLRLATGSADLPELYAEAMLEEWQTGTGDRRSVHWRKDVPPEALEANSVAIIGAGLSGLCVAIKLRELGIPFRIFEKNENLGGTWFENDYPGCGVDIPNAAYSYSFAPKPDWSREFSSREELQDYLEKCADDFDVRRSISFNTEVESARYDESADQWELTVRRKDGSVETVRSRFLACAVGQLNRPKVPDLPGLDKFKGPAFHTAEWDHSVDLASKRVAMIGTGASGIQTGPSIAPVVAKLDIYQRSPPWVGYNANYLSDVPDGMKWAKIHIPFFERWHRDLLWWSGADAQYPVLQKDPDWPTPDISLNKFSDNFRNILINHAKSQLGDDPNLLAKVIPTYPPFGKRMLRDFNWFKTLKRDNVELVTAGIREIDETGITDSDGNRRETDVIVLATGFHAARMLWPIDIQGRGGTTIRDVWGDEDPRAYLGMTVPDFPNMFVLYGPNTNLSHGGSIFFHAECQTRHIMLCLREVIEGSHRSIEVRREVHDDYNRRVDEQHEKMIWTHPGMSTWYRNSKGRVTANSPWRIIDYWDMTRHLDPGDYIFS